MSDIMIYPKSIVFKSIIDGETVFTIWDDEYDTIIEAIRLSKEYKKEQNDLENKYKSAGTNKTNTKTTTKKNSEVCKKCKGTGNESNVDFGDSCIDCNGMGEIYIDEQSRGGRE